MVLTASELSRLSVIRRYASVAYELPQWAQDVLSSQMGSIVVSAKDSFEIYISGLEGAVPKYDFVSFQKRFAEIFDRKAFLVLEKIRDHREKKLEYFVSNDYFWQEFRDLFAKECKTCNFFGNLFRSIEKVFWLFWNRKVLGMFGFGRDLAKVGLTGVHVNRRFPKKHNTSDVHPIKWR